MNKPIEFFVYLKNLCTSQGTLKNARLNNLSATLIILIMQKSVKD